MGKRENVSLLTVLSYVHYNVRLLASYILIVLSFTHDIINRRIPVALLIFHDDTQAIPLANDLININIIIIFIGSFFLL